MSKKNNAPPSGPTGAGGNLLNRTALEHSNTEYQSAERVYNVSAHFAEPAKQVPASPGLELSRLLAKYTVPFYIDTVTQNTRVLIQQIANMMTLAAVFQGGDV